MSVTQVTKKIKSIYNRRRIDVYALSLEYAAIAINYFWSVQPPKPDSQGMFWYNRTGQAAARMFTGAEVTENIVSWFMAHSVQYGVYLELSNDRKHASINQVIRKFVGRFYSDLGKLYRD